MPGAERSAEEIQRDIERSRAELARAVDQLAFRTNPKRLAEQAKQRLKQRANSAPGRIVIGATGAIVAVLIVRRVRKR